MGLILLFHAWSILVEGSAGERLVAWVRKTGQSTFGEYWNIHQYIVAAVLALAGLFFCAMAFSIFASQHDWWVLKWL